MVGLRKTQNIARKTTKDFVIFGVIVMSPRRTAWRRITAIPSMSGGR